MEIIGLNCKNLFHLVILRDSCFSFAQNVIFSDLHLHCEYSLENPKSQFSFRGYERPTVHTTSRIRFAITFRQNM
jgi:hypothetical protein